MIKSDYCYTALFIWVMPRDQRHWKWWQMTGASMRHPSRIQHTTQVSWIVGSVNNQRL